MALFDFLKSNDINEGVKEYEGVAGAVLLDVRTPQEYREGHIPESKNVPLQALEGVKQVVTKMDTPVFVYCYSEGRSRQAAKLLAQMGYTNIKDIGGIAAYTGKVER